MEKPTFRFALREDLLDCPEMIPSQANSTDTGFDCRAAQKDRQPIVLKPGQYVKIPLGFRMLPSPGYWAELKPRSSTFGKKHMHCLYGTIDQDYSGELVMAACYLPDPSEIIPSGGFKIEFGERIAQLIPHKLNPIEVISVSNEEYDNLVAQKGTTRGAGGFGSTGDK